MIGWFAGGRIQRKFFATWRRSEADAGVVKGSQHGRGRVWELEPSRLAKAREWLEQSSAQWDAAIGRLQDFLQKNP